MCPCDVNVWASFFFLFLLFFFFVFPFSFFSERKNNMEWWFEKWWSWRRWMPCLLGGSHIQSASDQAYEMMGTFEWHCLVLYLQGCPLRIERFRRSLDPGLSVLTGRVCIECSWPGQAGMAEENSGLVLLIWSIGQGQIRSIRICITTFGLEINYLDKLLLNYKD